MKKITFCIGKAISLVTDNFAFVLRMTAPVVLLTAVCLVVFPPIAIVPFLVLQAVMFRLWDVNDCGIVVNCQRLKSLYVHAGRNLAVALNPVTWWKALRFYFRHFSEMFGLTLSLLVLFGVVTLMLCSPLLVIHVMRYSQAQSLLAGDVVDIPKNINVFIYLVLFVSYYMLSFLMTALLTPFKFMVKACRKEDEDYLLNNLIDLNGKK